MFLAVLIAMVLPLGEVMADDPCEPYTDPVCGEASGNYNCSLSDFRGITAFSNGDWTGNGNCGKFQCVEYVRRVYRYEVLNILGSLGSKGWAVEAFDSWHNNSNLDQYVNGQSIVPPEPGDILCYSGGTYGHIAIVKGGSESLIETIEQNWSPTGLYDLAMTKNASGQYTVSSRGSYTVQGWLRDPNYNPLTYSCSYVGQAISPAGPYERGDTVSLQVKFKNEGNSTWSNIPGENYVELASCNQIGEVGLSFFNYNPLTETCFDKSVLNWKNCFVPTTFDEASVPPGEIGTFNFMGIVRQDALPLVQEVYFAPIYSGTIIKGWNETPYEPFEVGVQGFCYEPPVEVIPNNDEIDGQVCVGTFQQYNFPVIADGRTYKITVTPSTGEDVNLFSSNNPDDINNKDALLNWDATCPSGAIHCASSTQMGDAVEIIEFDAPTDGVNYQSWFSVYGASGDGMVDYTVKVESWVKKPDVGIDVVFIMDVTGSTGGLLPGWRTHMPSVIADIQSEFADARFGLVSHLDFPFNPYGGGGEWAYKLESPLSADPAVTISALGRISNGWGNDGPESQYEAIYQSLTGEGRDLNCDGDYNDNGEILPSHMGYDPNHLIILFHFTYPPIFHNRDVEPNYPFPGACPVAGRTMTIAIMKEKPVIYFGLVTTSMKKILIDPQTDEMIDNPLLFSGAVNPMQELADITGGAVLSVGSDLRGLDQAIKEAVDHVDLTKPGDLSVLVHKDSTPLQSVLVSVSDINGNQIDRGFTNSGGYLVSDSLPVGTYFVSILPPLGYTTITTIKEFNILPNGVTSVIFNLEQMDIVPTQQRLSYWKYKVHAAIYGNTKDDSLVNAYRFPLLADLIYNHFQNNPIHPIPIFGDYYPSSPRSKVFALLELLGGDLPEIDTITVPLDGVFSKSSFIDDGPWTYKIRAIRELTSLFLNITSNKLATRQVASTDGITVSQVITYTTDFIYDDDSTNDQESYNMLHDLNAGTMLRAGLIPSSIQEVFYMQSANGSNEMPTKFTLSQNYPNPFNPTTSISFSLPEASNVKLEVFNINGQVVTTLADGQFEAGVHQLTWDGRETASGMYFYKLTTNNFSETKKMLLLK